MDHSLGHLALAIVSRTPSSTFPFPNRKTRVGEFFSPQVLMKGFASFEDLVPVFLTGKTR